MSWQDEFREWFPITRDKAYANIAYTSPLAPKVADGVAAFFDGITRARSDKPQWLRDAGALRARLARLIGGDARRLAFTKNTTEGLNTVAQGLAWQEGDNLVVDDQEHPTNALPWLNLRRRGVQVRVPSARAHRYTVDDLWQHVDARTRLIAVSWVQYGTGLRTDIAELGRRCAERGIWLVVDGIQGAGLLRAEVDAWGVDAFACGAHKGMLGPLGVGLLHVSPRLLDALDPLYVGPSEITTLDKTGLQWQVGVSDAGDARRLETGNLNYPGIAGWAAALDLIEWARPERIEPWVLELSAALSDGLRAQGLQVVSPADAALRSTTTALRVADPAAALAHLAREGVVASIVEYGYVRLSVGAYNNHGDVDRVLRAARGFAA
ncbi:aminotransferase class V-fold PLP-dependent enzyme [Achromobacter xylosoxidans]|uniref:aminotransferase class V-fold PLP-dependent enzyme n=1 Tax=Alcaligenes xylosoxydans xylosoxydans TaxID=85698 RepID=UPI0006C0CC3E|nr:aminotransferase class V-fold PLP-dependent enzyme [Achromobacter xylosoxidans]QQE58618.1 aminotransferase class V-fold PLP-dependent enzyme [Achromobacter xylosoxidans]QQV12365.1 aminotransferase class V-fold PLP-dependent enzyme [Achromobacter xylosoxidans]UXL02406.1 aminotransferase class V-fold PLP-dependent enzyme [Achromobacter xylosoxidans]CUI59149.1 Cysteine sulfinate desulfinase [Achromobacter xylosoxidans]